MITVISTLMLNNSGSESVNVIVPFFLLDCQLALCIAFLLLCIAYKHSFNLHWTYSYNDVGNYFNIAMYWS